MLRCPENAGGQRSLSGTPKLDPRERGWSALPERYPKAGSSRQQLEAQFHERWLNLADAVSAARGAYPGYFSRGVEQDGAVANAERLVLAQRPSETFLELALMKRLDLTVEAVIQDSPRTGGTMKRCESPRWRRAQASAACCVRNLRGRSV